MISLNLSYDHTVSGAREHGEKWAVDQMAAALDAAPDMRRGGRFAIFGSSWTGQAMAKAIAQLGVGQVRFIVENRQSCRELEHLPHFRADECGQQLAQVDHLVLATSPRHYANIMRQFGDSLFADRVILPYAPEETASLDPNTRTMDLPVLIRASNASVVEASIPVAPAHTALVLIDVWDEGQERCPYCDKVPALLDAARAYGLLRIHAPTLDLVDDSTAFQGRKSDVPLGIARDQAWPPADFRLRQNAFEHLNPRSPLYGRSESAPLGIHSCAKPVPSEREMVVSDLETLLTLFQEHRILHVLYCGGGTLACLAFKPCGYLNILKEGYFPILIEDATHQKPRRFHGQDLDMVAPGIVTFQDRGGYTTTSARLIEALAVSLPAGKTIDGTRP